MILRDGLFTGKRLRACSDQARLYFPYYLVAANTLARLELDPPVLIARCFVEFKKQPTEEVVLGHFKEYEYVGLCRIYHSGFAKWVQFDVPEDCLPRHKAAADKRSPAPPEHSQPCENLREPAKSSADFGENVRGVGVGVGVGVGEGKPLPIAGTNGRGWGFDEFWKDYPRRIAKKAAAKAFNTLKAGEVTTLERNLPPWLDEFAARPDDKIPYPATYLRSGQWMGPPRPRGGRRIGMVEPSPELEWVWTVANVRDAVETRRRLVAEFPEREQESRESLTELLQDGIKQGGEIEAVCRDALERIG